MLYSGAGKSSLLNTLMSSSPVSAQADGTGLPPRWARAVDIVCLVLLLLVVVVAAWGGFRERIGPVRIALTDPWRLLLAAVLLAAVRHGLAPRPAIYAWLPRQVRARLSTPQARAAWNALLFTRPAILFVGLLAVVMFGYKGGEPPLRLSPNEVANLQVRWDMAWYSALPPKATS